MPDKTLDTKGLACPLPILKTKKALSELPKGAKLEVLATDPGSVPDFTAFCESTGNVLLEQQLAAVTHERDNLRSRLNAARSRIDALLERLPAEPAPSAAESDATGSDR